MKKLKTFCIALLFYLAFILWTIAVIFINVKQIGPNNSEVGLSKFNGFFHKKIGVNMTLYDLTDLLSIIPIAIMLFFGLLGLVQWIKRKSLLKIDYSIRILGLFYILVFAVYIFFEFAVVNYRPTLIEGKLEASYPSSTTMLVICIMTTALMQVNERVKNKKVKISLIAIILAFSVFMVVGRIISGVHWVSDIIAGMLLSGGLVATYYALIKMSQIQ